MIAAPDAQILDARRAALVAADPALARAHAQTPAFAWRSRPGGFAGLFRMIVEQQVSVASAAAIWKRVEDGIGEVTPDALLAQDAETLRGWGLSGRKARYGREIALAHIEGRIDPAHLRTLDDAAAVAALTAIKGVGRWTAEIYLMFCEGRADLFPGGDIALQEGARRAKRLDVRPSPAELEAIGEAWRPQRATAARLLWHLYLSENGRRETPV